MREAQYHYWIVTRDPSNGRPYLIYGDADENRARLRGMELLGGLDFELKRLRTSNLQRASSLLKGNRLEQTKSLREASRRLGHDKSMRRLQQRRLRANQTRTSQTRAGRARGSQTRSMYGW